MMPFHAIFFLKQIPNNKILIKDIFLKKKTTASEVCQPRLYTHSVSVGTEVRNNVVGDSGDPRCLPHRPRFDSAQCGWGIRAILSHLLPLELVITP